MDIEILDGMGGFNDGLKGFSDRLKVQWWIERITGSDVLKEFSGVLKGLRDGFKRFCHKFKGLSDGSKDTNDGLKVWLMDWKVCVMQWIPVLYFCVQNITAHRPILC